MKQQILQLLNSSLETLAAKGEIPAPAENIVQIENTRDESHGDIATNLAMILAKTAKRNPRDLAAIIIENLPESDLIEKTEIAGPGFINFFLRHDAYQSIIAEILKQKDKFGESIVDKDKSVILEFVSANPTGPLHIGHGRGAAYGAAVANLLRKVGYDVNCEYYINDAGRQMDILTTSIWLRYLQLCKQEIPFPDNAYKGEYIKRIAKEIYDKNNSKFNTATNGLLNLFDEEDPEIQIDNIINYCRDELGSDCYQYFFNAGLDSILNNIKRDLEDFGVVFDNWFSESSIVEKNTIKQCIDKLKKNNWVYEKEGAQWFSSSKFGDEKDRVLVRENGQSTYFASDIAYHSSKVERGYEKIIDIWGADHHGYITRVKASMQALGLPADKLEILLVQFATLYRGKEKLQMSTRSGEFITLKELQQEVGKDAARFFYILRKSEQHLDFDLELAKSQSNDNPVYYIQYAHARICSVFKQLTDKGYNYDNDTALSNLSVLSEPHETTLLRTLARFPDVIEISAKTFEPHQLAYYLKDLANDFHSYYNSNQFLVEDNIIRNARLALINATKQVIFNGLSILGVDSPEVM